jgi:hypothetical protein
MQRWFLCALLVAACVSQAVAQSKVLLEGNVVNAITGDPMPGARVKLARSGQQPQEGLYAKTDAQGAFRFTGLNSELYTLTVERPGFFRTGEATHMSPTIDLRNLPVNPNRPAMPPRTSSDVKLTKVVEEDGTVHATAAVSLTPYGAIAGKVTDPNGVPLRDVAVHVYLKQPIQKRQGTLPMPMAEVLPDGQSEAFQTSSVNTNDQGEFRAARLAAGTYYVAALKYGGYGAWLSSYRSTYFPHALNLASAKPVELTAGQEGRADIQIASLSGVRIAGRIVKPETPASEGAPGTVPYTNLSLTPQQNQIVNQNGPFTTSMNDQFSMDDILPGKYTLTATAYAGNRAPFGGSQKPLFGAIKEVEVTDRGLEGLTVELQTLPDIAGTVVFNEGCPQTPLRIAVQGSSMGMPISPVTPGADGKFVLSGLSPGRLWLNVSIGAVAGPGLTGTVVAMAGRPAAIAGKGWVESANFGDSDVLHNTFNYPPAKLDSLRIIMQCGGQNGRPQ